MFTFQLGIAEVGPITPPNGYVLAIAEVGDPAQTVDYIVDLEALGIACSPCGNTWQFFFGYGVGSTSSVTGIEGNMTLEIVDVTY